MNWEDPPRWLDVGAKLVGITTVISAVTLFSWRRWVKRRKFIYPTSGEVGPNILGQEFVAVKQGHHVSMGAIVPTGSQLVIALSGSTYQKGAADGTLLEASAAWHFHSMPPPLNWTPLEYVKGGNISTSTQSFEAEEGQAELDIYFTRTGVVAIAAYEHGSYVPTWTKTIDILPRD